VNPTRRSWALAFVAMGMGRIITPLPEFKASSQRVRGRKSTKTKPMSEKAKARAKARRLREFGL